MKNKFVIKYEDKLDLYLNGNYIDSYDSYDEIENYIQLHNETLSNYQIKSQTYSIIKSKHINFEED